SVIMSMHCLRECPLRGQCYKACPEKRHVCGVPVVPGEVGTGPTGMVRTVPGAFGESDAVIVYGHGVFTAGEKDFNGPFQRMREVEEECAEEYFGMVERLSRMP
ncbi:MAG: rRNA adenine dimethylase, partial [Nitrospirae bacterium]|nr:rRNA adenine dimethylase [Nitrospirota bacterium]